MEEKQGTAEAVAKVNNKRPGIGLGVWWYNEHGEVLLGMRIGSSGGTMQFPGGHIEFGETFGQWAAREMAEETGVIRDPMDYKYVTTVNVIRPEYDYHYVTIIMSINLNKNTEIINMEPEKNAGWDWYSWDDVKSKTNLFYSISELINWGYNDISKFT